MNVIEFKPDDYSKCAIASDFYKAVGMESLIKGSQISSVYQMRINPATNDAIVEQLCKNYKRNKHTRIYTKEKAARMIRFDWMNFAPVADELVPENQIWWEDKK